MRLFVSVLQFPDMQGHFEGEGYKTGFTFTVEGLAS